MASRRKRSCYDAACKPKVVEFVEKYGNKAAERENTILEKLVRDWGKAKESLLEMPKMKKSTMRKATSGPWIGKKLVEWVTEQRNSRYIVTMLHIQQTASKLSINPSFKASIGWAQKFIKRHRLTLRLKTNISQNLPDDLKEQILSFHRFVIQQRKAHQFKLSQNMDKTPMCFDKPSNRTIDQKGMKCTIFIVQCTQHTLF